MVSNSFGRGHTAPAIETREKMALALEVPLYQFFYEGNKEPKALDLPKVKTSALSRKDSHLLTRLGGMRGRIKPRDKSLLLGIAAKLTAAR
jgi:hypothetical protein